MRRTTAAGTPPKYALANVVDHPKTVYVREADVVPHLDWWLARVFAPDRIDETAEALSASQARPDEQEARLVAARRSLREAEARIASYREALDSGTDPSVVAGWIREAVVEKARAEQLLKASKPAPLVSPEDIKVMLRELGNLVRVNRGGGPSKKTELYASLALTLIYQPGARVVLAETDVGRCAQNRVGGGI
jgi:site-specific DNA recombinase